MGANKNQITGNTSMLIMKLLAEKDMYGYEMIEVLSQRSKNVFELKVGTLYPLLHGLVKAGHLKSYDMEVGGKVRKYYQITSGGRKQLELMLKEWTAYSKAVSDMIGGVCYGCE